VFSSLPMTLSSSNGGRHVALGTPGGAVLWYDFTVDTHLQSRRSRALPLKRVRELFPQARVTADARDLGATPGAARLPGTSGSLRRPERALPRLRTTCWPGPQKTIIANVILKAPPFLPFALPK
jgi:hypothetical protein